MAAHAGTDHRIMIHCHNWGETGRSMTQLTIVGGVYVILWLTRGLHIVMAGHTVIVNTIVGETRRNPAEITVTTAALIVRGYMVDWFSFDSNIVVARLATSKYLIVIDPRHIFP